MRNVRARTGESLRLVLRRSDAVDWLGVVAWELIFMLVILKIPLVYLCWVVWWAIAHWFKLPLTYLGWKGKQVRDVLFVDDMLALIDMQIRQIGQFRGEVFNVGGGAANAISLCEATQAMQEVSSRSTTIKESDQVRKGDIVLYWTDNRKAMQKLCWQPRIDLRTGFRGIFEWIRQNENALRTSYLQ